MPLFGLALYALLTIADPHQYADIDYYQHWGGWAHCFDIAFCIIGSFVISELSLMVSRLLDGQLPWERRPLTRLGIQFVLITATSWLAIQLIVQVVV